MSFQELKSQHPRIAEINQVVGVYEIYVEGIEKKLKIKIIKFGLSESDSFMGIANLAVKGKDCCSPYRSMHTYSTEDAALREAIDGFFAFFRDDAEIIEVDW